MPVWLTVLLSVYGSLFPIMAAGWKWGKGITDSIRAMSQWFDGDSALGKQQGTLPEQMTRLNSQVKELVERERVLERVLRTEEHVAELERHASAMEQQMALIEANLTSLNRRVP